MGHAAQVAAYNGVLLSREEAELFPRNFALQVFARALGLDETDLYLYEPLPGAHAYTAYMAWLALYGSEAQVAAGYPGGPGVGALQFGPRP